MLGLSVLEKVEKQNEPKTSTINNDNNVKMATQAFDYEFNGTSYCYPWNKPTKIPNDFKIGLIVGASGSGKSTLLNEFGEEECVIWNKDEAIISHFSTSEEAVDKLSAVGLNSIPSWVKPYHVLSTGEKFRVDLARRLKNGAVIDEFTSVVDRNVAKSCATALSKYIKRQEGVQIILATCHEDIVEWLEPCWIFNANEGILYDGRSLRRPTIELEIYEGKRSMWELFKNHHYLSGSLSPSARCFVAVWNNEIVAFSATIAMPNGNLKNAWRGHRLVVLPDYQGMGIGTRLSDTVAQIHIGEGKRFFSRTAHYRLGTYRDNNPKWKKTSKYKKLRTDVDNKKQDYNNMFFDTTRVCFSHEYVGILKES